MSSSSEPEGSAASQTLETPSPQDSGHLNEAHDVDLEHSEEDYETIREILDGSEIQDGHEFSTEETHRFSQASGDDQGVHDNLNPRTIRNFHEQTAGIMADNPSAYRDGEVSVGDLDERERFIVQGALATSMVVSSLPELMKRNPTSISAMHNRPVKHHPRDSHTAEIDEDLNLLVEEYDIPAATHEVLEYDEDADIDYAGNMYALSKGMSFDDRNGDVLLGFLEINMTDYDFQDLEELHLDERTLVEDAEELEFYEGDIPDAEAMNLDHVGDVNAYRNTVVDQTGEEVVEYVELNLQDVEYEEADDSAQKLARAYRNLVGTMMESGVKMFTP
jgi:hypothetical protein